MSNMGKELQGLEEEFRAKIHRDSEWKTPGHGGIYGYWL